MSIDGTPPEFTLEVPEAKRYVEGNWGDPYFGFVNYYIHQVNLLRYLLGEPYRVTFADRGGVLLAAKVELEDSIHEEELEGIIVTLDADLQLYRWGRKGRL